MPQAGAQLVVGDVGGGNKLDYTAYGTVINTASRLEAANKELKSTICVGPGAAALLPAERLRPLGRLKLRGRSAPSNVYDPWPESYTEADRKSWSDALDLADTDPERAAVAMEAIAARRKGDPVAKSLLARLHRPVPAAVTI